MDLRAIVCNGHSTESLTLEKVRNTPRPTWRPLSFLPYPWCRSTHILLFPKRESRALLHLQGASFVGELWLQLSYRPAVETASQTKFPLIRSVSYDHKSGWRSGTLWGVDPSKPWGLDETMKVCTVLESVPKHVFDRPAHELNILRVFLQSRSQSCVAYCLATSQNTPCSAPRNNPEAHRLVHALFLPSNFAEHQQAGLNQTLCCRACHQVQCIHLSELPLLLKKHRL